MLGKRTVQIRLSARRFAERPSGEVAVGEGPVGRPPALRPQAVLGDDRRKQLRMPGGLSSWPRDERAVDHVRHQRPSEIGQVDAVVRDSLAPVHESPCAAATLSRSRILRFGEIHEHRTALRSDRLHRFRISAHLVVAHSEIWHVREGRFFKPHRRDQHHAHSAG